MARYKVTKRKSSKGNKSVTRIKPVGGVVRRKLGERLLVRAKDVLAIQEKALSKHFDPFPELPKDADDGFVHLMTHVLERHVDESPKSRQYVWSIWTRCTRNDPYTCHMSEWWKTLEQPKVNRTPIDRFIQHLKDVEAWAKTAHEKVDRTNDKHAQWYRDRLVQWCSALHQVWPCETTGVDCTITWNFSMTTTVTMILKW